VSRIGALFIGALSCVIVLSPSLATATVLMNADYYQEGIDSPCTAPPAIKCTINFLAPSPNDYFVIQNVSCLLDTDQSAKIREWSIRPVTPAGSANGFKAALNPVALSNNGTVRTFQVSQPITLLVYGPSHSQITVLLWAGKVTHMNCTITGKPVTL
jgi:hypothetical protein